MSELKHRKGRQETYESFKGGEEKVEVYPENLISLMVILNFTDSPFIPKLFLMLMKEQFNVYLVECLYFVKNKTVCCLNMCVMRVSV